MNEAFSACFWLVLNTVNLIDFHGYRESTSMTLGLRHSGEPPLVVVFSPVISCSEAIIKDLELKPKTIFKYN